MRQEINDLGIHSFAADVAIIDDDILDADGWEPTMDYTYDEWIKIQDIFNL